MAKVKQYSIKEDALHEMIAAAEALERAEARFNDADSAYFEIANVELSIAQLQLAAATKKMKLACY